MHHSNLRVDRLVLNNLPTAHAALDGDLTAVNAAHAEWMYRLSGTSLLIDHPALHMHRLIISGEQDHAGTEDFVDVQYNGSWAPEMTEPVLELLSHAGSTTPLSGYVGLDGPFADSDPSFYL